MKKYILPLGLISLVSTFIIGDFIRKDLDWVLKILGCILIFIGMSLKKQEENK